MKSNSLWKVLAVLAKKSEIWLRTRGTWMILNSGKQIWSVSIFSNSVAKLGHSWGSFIIAISSLQSVPKLWHGECWSIFSIAYRSASTSECNADSHRVKFRVPISCMFSPLSIQTHPHPLKRSEVVQDPSSMQILPKLKTWMSSLSLACTTGGIISFALNHAWHSLSAYQTSSKGSLSIPLNSLSLRAFQIYQIIQGLVPKGLCRFII